MNERFGQEAGDQALRQFGARLVAQVRPRDIVARWGADKFAVICDCAAAGANARAQQIASGFRAAIMFPSTASIGNLKRRGLSSRTPRGGG